MTPHPPPTPAEGNEMSPLDPLPIPPIRKEIYARMDSISSSSIGWVGFNNRI